MPPVHLRRSQHPESSVSYASGPPSEPPSEAPSIGESFTPSPEAGNTRPPQRKTGIDLYWAQIDSQQELPGDEDLSDFMHVYRRHNSSLPVLEGQMILCRVLSVSRQSLLLDTGTSTARCLHSQISPAQLVQSSRTDTSTRTGPSDYRVGDLIKFRLEDIMSPYGDVVLETRANAKSPAKDDVFAELVEAYEKRRHVMGRVLNSVNGGFAVGVSGMVGFCPFSRMDPRTSARIGVLQPFSILKFDQGKRDLVVSDLLKAAVWNASQPSSRPRPLWKTRQAG
ncbi:hypothetical protein WJX74_002589 [Apatococcus lobatus]|uniref:S1 motif domain-containing protein n=2 Tax=Apatococcus TaxID=904362 RepID=A0AAW1TGJ1_9CHLO